MIKLNPAFEQQFPELGKNYLTQNHIDLQRKKISEKNANDDSAQPKINSPNGDAKKQSINSCTKVTDIKQAVHSASSMISNQGVYLVDLLDERGSRNEAKTNDKLKDCESKTVCCEGLIKPNELTANEVLANTNDIKTKAEELVDLLVKRREHEASQRTGGMNDDRSIFVGYLAERRPNKRAYRVRLGL